jgi:hypothetical protein
MEPVKANTVIRTDSFFIEVNLIVNCCVLPSPGWPTFHSRIIWGGENSRKAARECHREAELEDSDNLKRKCGEGESGEVGFSPVWKSSKGTKKVEGRAAAASAAAF